MEINRIVVVVSLIEPLPADSVWPKFAWPTGVKINGAYDVEKLDLAIQHSEKINSKITHSYEETAVVHLDSDDEKWFKEVWLRELLTSVS